MHNTSALCCLNQRFLCHTLGQHLVAMPSLAEGDVLMGTTNSTCCIDIMSNSLECFQAVIFLDTFVKARNA